MADIHATSLSKLCRICGLILTKYAYKVAGLSESIKSSHFIDVTQDNPALHPDKICQKCHLTLKNIRDRGSTPCHGNVVWEPHSDTQCKTCNHKRKVFLGGRPVKKKNLGGLPATTLFGPGRLF